MAAIDRLIRLLPAGSIEYSYDPPAYLDVASQVSELIGAGRANDLTAFFMELDALHAETLETVDEVALNEGLMETLIDEVARLRIPPESVYRQLGPHSQAAWRGHWEYIYERPWPAQ